MCMPNLRYLSRAKWTLRCPAKMKIKCIQLHTRVSHVCNNSARRKHACIRRLRRHLLELRQRVTIHFEGQMYSGPSTVKRSSGKMPSPNSGAYAVTVKIHVLQRWLMRLTNRQHLCCFTCNDVHLSLRLFVYLFVCAFMSLGHAYHMIDAPC